VDGYYDPLLALFEKGATEGFINPDCKQIFVSAPNASELLTKMEVTNGSVLFLSANPFSSYHYMFPLSSEQSPRPCRPCPCSATHPVAPGGSPGNELGDLGARVRARRRAGRRLLALRPSPEN
jgi:hypothetical protein